MGTDAKKIITQIVYYPILAIICLEISLLIMGYRSYTHTNFSVFSEPQHAYIGHTEYGIQLNPGKYDITINDSLKFTAIHTSSTQRAQPVHETSRAQIAMLGCSFTYGFGVNDDDHFTALLQEEFPQVHFNQHAVIGHGTVQALMELRQIVDDPKLKAVFLHIASEHLMRNTLSPTYRSHLKIGYGHSGNHVDNQMNRSRFPYIENCNGPIQYIPWTNIYDHWPGRQWSATINWLQTTYDRWLEDIPGQIEVTACLIREMEQLCQSNNIAFGVVSIDNHPDVEMLRSQLLSINWIDTHFDFSSPELTNKPFDNHPSIKGHRYLANKIKPHIIQLLDE